MGLGDPRTIGLFLLGIVLLVVWVTVENRSSEPLVDMKMMRIRGVWTVNAAAFLVGAGMYSSFILIPQFVETPESAGYGFASSVTGAGLFLLPATLGMLFVSPLAGRMTNRFGARLPLVLGSLATALAFGFLALEHDHPWEFYVGAALLGIGIGLAFASLANLIVAAVRPDQTGVATGMNTVMRTVGGSVGSTIVASVIAGTVAGAAPPTEAGFTSGVRPGRRRVPARRVREHRRPRPVLAPVPVPPAPSAYAPFRRDCADQVRPARLAVRRAAGRGARRPGRRRAAAPDPRHREADAHRGVAGPPGVERPDRHRRLPARPAHRVGPVAALPVAPRGVPFDVDLGPTSSGGVYASTGAARRSRGGRRACRPTRRARAATSTGSTSRRAARCASRRSTRRTAASTGRRTGRAASASPARTTPSPRSRTST